MLHAGHAFSYLTDPKSTCGMCGTRFQKAENTFLVCRACQKVGRSAESGKAIISAYGDLCSDCTRKSSGRLLCPVCGGIVEKTVTF
jgi:hypothetical protein